MVSNSVQMALPPFWKGYPAGTQRLNNVDSTLIQCLKVDSTSGRLINVEPTSFKRVCLLGVYSKGEQILSVFGSTLIQKRLDVRDSEQKIKVDSVVKEWRNIYQRYQVPLNEDYNNFLYIYNTDITF